MSTENKTAPAEPTAEPENDSDQTQVSVEVDQLIIGRAIRFPVHDPNGLLLLSEDSVITSEFKRLLKTRQISQIRVHEDDAELIAFSKVELEPAIEAVSQRINLDNEFSRQLDEVVDSGMPYVTNQGPSVRENVIAHGCEKYDSKKREQLVNEFLSTNESLNEMMADISTGEDLHGEDLVAMTSNFLGSMTDDMDSVLNIPFEVGENLRLARHCMNMSLLGMAIGVEMGLNEENVRRIGVTGLVHDWGMLRVPEKIRESKRPLTPIEMLEIKKHPIYSLDILRNISGLPSLVPLISYQVHEKLDGSGYPRGRTAKNIHLFSRILHVADDYVSLTSSQPYRPALTSYAAIETILHQDDSRAADPLVVRALLRVKSLFPVGSFITLSDASVAKVLRRNGDLYTQPIVQLIQDGEGQKINPETAAAIIDLNESELTVAQALPTPGRKEVTAIPHAADGSVPTPKHRRRRVIGTRQRSRRSRVLSRR